MRPGFVSALVTAWVLATPEVTSAQFAQISGAGTSVTFTLPVNLTQLSPDLDRVRMICDVQSDGVLFWPVNLYPTLESRPMDEVIILGGRLVATMSVFIPIPVEFLKDPIGKTAEYTCGLMGFSRSLQRWDAFDEASSVPAFFLKPTPVVRGTFTWTAP